MYLHGNQALLDALTDVESTGTVCIIRKRVWLMKSGRGWANQEINNQWHLITVDSSLALQKSHPEIFFSTNIYQFLIC